MNRFAAIAAEVDLKQKRSQLFVAHVNPDVLATVKGTKRESRLSLLDLMLDGQRKLIQVLPEANEICLVGWPVQDSCQAQIKWHEKQH
eukprot:m.249193 g.249193  ORF g.249193 m.249193 type:complete len:88 (-) comp19085_c2_seq1:1066-1329(-)